MSARSRIIVSGEVPFSLGLAVGVPTGFALYHAGAWAVALCVCVALAVVILRGPRLGGG